jgi:hypothetical protein
MIEAIENLVERCYQDSIELPDNRWLVFNRISEYRGSNRGAVTISIEDLELGTKIELAKYFDSKWTFPVPKMESIFWKNAKEYSSKFKEIFDRLRKPVPNKVGLEYKIRAKQLKAVATLSPSTASDVLDAEKL